MGNQEDLKFVADDKSKKDTQDKDGKPVISDILVNFVVRSM